MFFLHSFCCTKLGNCPQAESQGGYGVISCFPFLWVTVLSCLSCNACLIPHILCINFVVAYSIQPSLEPIILSWPEAEVPPTLFLLTLYAIHPSSQIPVTCILSYLILSHKKLSPCSFLFRLFSLWFSLTV